MTDQTVTLRLRGDAAGIRAASRDADESIKGIGKAGTQAGSETAKGMKKAEAATKDLDRAAGGVSGKLRSVALASAAVATAAGAALVALAKNSIDLADQTAKMSQKVGVSIEALSTLQYAADRAGVGTEQLRQGLVLLSKGAAETAAGTGESRIAFEALGLSVTDTAGKVKSSDILLREIAGRFAGFEDGASKTAIAVKLFGEAGAQLIPLLNQGADGIAAMEDRARALGLELDANTAKSAEAFNDLLADLGSLAQGFGNDIARELLPSLQSLTEQFVQSGIEGRNASSVAEGFATVLKTLAAAAFTVKGAVEALVNIVAASIDVFVAASKSARDLAANYTLWGLILKDSEEQAKSASQIWEEFSQRASAATSSAGTGIDIALRGVSDAFFAIFNPAVEEGAAKVEELADTGRRAAPVLKRLADNTSALRQAEALRDRAAAKSAAAAQSLNRILTQQAANLGGPSVAAALAYRDELTELLSIEQQLASTNSLSADAVAGLAQARANAAEQFAQDMQDIAEANVEVGRTFEDVLAELADTPFNRLIQDIQLIQEELARVGDAASEAFDPERAAELQRALGTLRSIGMQGVISGTQEILGALQGVVKQGSDEMKALELAQHALNLAMAIGGIVNQANGDPYTAWARMAAMAVTMAGYVGQNFGGANGFTDTAAQRQRTQGTGTVLGDPEAKSQSIVNAVEITADATSQLVGINRGMLRALIALQDGIANATGMLARGAGRAEFDPIGGSFTFADNFLGGRLSALPLDPLNILGGSSRVTDSGLLIGGGGLGDINVGAYQEQQYRRWRFGSRRTREDVAPVAEELQAQFQLVIDSLVDTVREGALALGLLPAEIEAALSAFQLEEIRISLKDLSAEDQRAELLAVFSSIFDNLAGDVVPFIEQFQRVGEGLGETLVRVATGVQVTREALDRLGFSLEAANPEQFAQISESLINMVGGIEEFINGMQSFVDNFAPEDFKFDLLLNDLTRALTAAGLALPETRDGMWALMQSLDATTEAGREQIATLLRLSGTADAYYTMLERNQEQAQQEQEGPTLEELAQAEAQRVADLESLMRGFRDRAFDAAITLAEWDFTPLQRELAAIDREMQRAMQSASMLGASEQELAEIRAGFAAQALIAQRRAEESLNDLLDGLRFDDMLAGLSEVEQQIARNNARYAEYIAQAIALGASEEQLAEIRGYQVRENERIAATAEAAAASVGRVGDQLQQIADLANDVASSMLRVGEDLRSWINQITGYSPEVEAATSTLADVQAEIRRRYAMEEANLGGARNNLIRQLLAEGYDLDGGGIITPTVRVLLGQLAAVDVALENIGQQMLDMEEYAAEAFLARQRAVLAGLREWRDSLLQNTQLTTLTPEQRFADIQRRYLETLAAAQAGDLNAQESLQSIAQQYLQQAREMFASGQQYTDIFAQVLADTGAIIEDAFGDGDSVADAIQSLADAPVFAGQLQVLQSILAVLSGGGSGVIAAGVASDPDSGAVAELRALREESKASSAAMVERLARVEQAQRDGAEKQAAEYRRTADLMKVRG